MVEIRNGDDVKKWLFGKPEDWAWLLRYRFYLRLLPAYGIGVGVFDRSPGWRNRYVLPFLRALIPVKRKFEDNIWLFDQEGGLLYFSLYANLPKMVDWYRVGGGIFVRFCMIRFFEDDINKFVDVESLKLQMANISEISDVSEIDMNHIASCLSLDATALESGVDLWSQPLWLDDIPEWAAQGWENLATELTKRTPYWSTLVRWYEDRLRGDDWAASQGRPAIRELEIARASLPDSYWKKGGKAVNLAIAELEDFFWNGVPLKDPALRELVNGIGVITDERTDPVPPWVPYDYQGATQPEPPLPPEPPPQSPRAFQFTAPPGGPIDLAPILPEDVLNDAPDRRDDFAELLFKAQELAAEGANRLGRVGVPVERLLALGDDLSRIRAKLLWSRINTLRIVLQGHVAALEGGARGGEPDERLLDGMIAGKLTDIVQTANIFVSGDANLLELDARRSGPQELAAAKQEVAIIAPLVAKVASDRVMTAVLSGEVIKEQVENVTAAEDTLAGRQAAELGAKTSRNFFSVLLSLGRREALDGGKDIKSGAYRAAGAMAFGALAPYGSYAGTVFASFIAQNAEVLVQYVRIAFNNVDVELLIQMIASLP